MGSNCCKCGNDKKNKQLASSSSDSSGPWTRGDDPLTGERFSSSTQRGAVTLSVRNASVEDSGRYSLSASNDGGSAQTDLLLEVRTRPGDVPVFLRRLNDLAVKVGTRTRFLVEVRSSTQVKVSWEQEGRPVVDGERFHLLHEGSFFCVDVAPVTLDDAGLWICRSHNANGTATCFCHLNVLVPKAYKAPHFLEELMALLTQQGTVSLECKVVGVPTPTLRWFKDSKEIKAGDVFALTANPQDATSLGTYTCEATNCMGKAYSTSKVHVLGTDKKPIESLIPRGPAPVFAKELRNEKVKIGGKLTLECKVTVPPWPSSISWYNKEGQVVTGGRYRVTEDGLGAYGVEVDPVQAVDEGQWKCVATSDCGAKGYSTGHVTVSYPKNYKKPRFLESLKAILTEEGLVSFECKVVGYPTPQLQWFKDGQELRPGDVYQLTGTNSLGSYCCIARNCMGETSSTAELTVEDIQSQLNEEERMQLLSTNQPPRFMQGLKSMESKITEHLRLTVQVSVSPQPAVAWYRDDEEVQDSEKYKKEQETKGFCHLTIKKLELVDQAEWKCVATNDYGQSVTSCFLKLNIPRHFKKPRFLENLRAVLSEEGAVNLECKVIGVPQPTLKWYKDGRELKPGDIHRIISGQDGTCCLGTYTCEATNCMGTVASSASLLGFEDRAQVKTPEPLRPVPPPAAHLVRQPSLSTIQEERTSQMHDVTATLDDRNEVSFSFDGKEVSVSLYETPDLTEEEALQVVEMYAEELSEHISEHNVVELPPMRFVKETSTSGHLLMEAVVIDVSPEYYASAEDRTEADLDEFSITEDNGLLSPAVLAAEEMPFDSFTSDFLERSLQPMSLPLKQPVPLKPPRKRSAERSESEYHSLKEAKVSPEEENSEPFVDALSSPKDRSTREAFASATSGSEEKKGAVTNVERSDKKEGAIMEVEIDVSLKESDGKIKEAKTLRKKSRSRSHSTESRLADKVDGTDPEKKCVKKLKKRKSSDSEKEDDSLREFEKRKSLKSENDKGDVTKRSTKSGALKKHRSSESEKEDDSLQEFESRKFLQKSEQDIAGKFTKTKKSASDSSGREDDSLIEYEKRKRDVSEKPKLERQKLTISKSISTDSSEKDEAFAIKSESSEARKKKKKSVKRSSSTENKDQTSETGVEIPPSSEAESYGRESYKGKKGVSTSDLDRMRSTSDLESIGDKSRGHEEDEHSADFDTAEDSAYDKSEMSVLESLTHSVNEIRKGLAAVGEKVVSESSEEPQSAVSSLSVIESLAQPISEIQRGLARVEKIAEQCEAGQYSPSSILETLKEPIKELQRNLAVIEEAQVVESDKESLLKRTSQTVLETVCQPLQELQKEIAFIQQQAVIETGEDTYSEMLKSFKPSLLVVQGGVEQSEREPSSKLDDLTDATVIPQATYAQSVQELQRGLAEIRDQQVLQGDQSESCVPLTVQDIEDSFAETATSVTTIGGLDLSSELMTYGIKLQSCMKSLKDKAQTAGNEEIRDILLSTSDLIPPLEQFKTVVEKCLKYVAQNEQSTEPQIRSANVVLKASLEGPVHALDKSLHLLESIANSKSDKEIRGLGIKVLYKLSFPLEELKTTMKLVENLSEQTSIELMTTPVETLITSAEVINLEDSKVGFVEDIPSEGVKLLKQLDDSSNALSSALQFVTKSLSVHSPLSTLKSLSKPLADLQKNLRKIDKKINTQDKCDQLSCSEVHSLAQDLCKPLQAIRTELSIAQHEIELDQYSQITIAADPVSGAKVESAACVVHESLEQTLKSVLTCTEFILSKTPNERSHVRYLLYALNELIIPLNQLTSSITKAGDLVRKEAPTLAEPEVGIQVVTTSTNGLLDALSALQHQSVTSLPPPESAVIQEVCTMADPLAQVENGLHRIIKHVHEEDKQVLNINMLKTLAEPFKYLQKSLLNISEKLDSELVSQEIFLDLRQPIQELQRSILIIQDQVSFEYGDEPATIESNIITLQSLVQPMNALRKQFMEIDGMMLEESQSTAYDQENKHLHSIINANHEVQLKLSSIMIEENYLTKHSLDSLDMFPIFQNLSGVLRDFENALNRVALVCQNQTKPDVLSHNKMCETVNSFKGELVELQNRIVLVSNKAIKDVKHPVHSLKKETEKLLDVIVASSDVITKCTLDDSSIMSANTTFSKNMCKAFSEFLNYLVQLENVSDYSPNEDASKLSANVSLISSSDTIKDVTTIVEEITRSRVSLESDIPSKHTSLLKTCSELQSFCDSLKTAENSILKNTLVKANSLNVDKDEERRALRNAFNNMKDQLEKIENHVTNNQEALESINHLKYTIEVIQEHLTYGEEISEVYILQNLSGPLRTFKDSITKDTCVTSTEPIDTASISTYLEKFEKSASDLELGLMKLEHALLNTTGDYSNLKNIDIGVLAHPIEELVHFINIIEEQEKAVDQSETLAEQSSFSMLKTLATPIREIQQGVVEIQEQIALESITKSSRSCAGILYDIAKPIRELRSGVALIQEQIVILEADVEPFSDDTRVSSLKTLAAPVQELKRVLTSIIQQQTLMLEPDVQSMSENLSILKTIAQPINELQNKLAAIEMNQIMEGNVDSMSFKETLLTLAQPILVLQEGIAKVENQLVLEHIGEDISVQTNISLLKMVAKPLLEVAKGIALVTEEQLGEKGLVEDVSVMSDLSTFANLTDVSMATDILRIDEPVVLEHDESFSDNLPSVQVARLNTEKALEVGICQQQQSLIGEDIQSLQESAMVRKPEHLQVSTEVVQEVCSPIVALQQTLSQADTLTLTKEKTLQAANIKDSSMKEAIQGHIQEALLPVEILSTNEESLKVAQIQEGDSIQTQKQVKVEAVSVQEDVLHAEELQQSLADVDSFKTEEDTLKSIRGDKLQSLSDIESFKSAENEFQASEPKDGSKVALQKETELILSHAAVQAEIQEFISVAEGIQSLKEELQGKIASNLSLSQAVKQDIQKVIAFAEEINLIKEDLTAKSIEELSLQQGAQVEMQLVLNACEQFQQVKKEFEVKPVKELSLESSVQTEVQQIISTVDDLNIIQQTIKARISAVSSANVDRSEVNEKPIVLTAPIQSDIGNFISVAEEIISMKDNVEAKLTTEPQIKKAAKQEIQLLLACAEEIQSVKTSLQAKLSSEPLNQQATQIEIKQVLHACDSLQNAKEALEAKSGKLKLQSAVQAELQQILSSADTLQTIKQSITAKVAEVESLNSTAQIEKVEIKTSVEHPDKLDKAPSTKADKVVEKTEVQPQLTTTQSKPQQELPTEEGSVKTPIQTDIQEFISVAEDFKDVKETLQAKIASEPQLKKAAQQEIQQLLSCVDEIQAVKESLQAKTASEPSFHQATEIEIQQVLHACESLQNAKEALEAKSGKLKLHSAVQAELQQILSSADTLQTIKQAITAKVAEVESLNSTAQIENVEIKTSVEHPDKLDKAPSTKADKVVEKSEVQPQLTTTQSKPQQEVPTEEGSVKTPIQTDIQEFISVAEDFKDVKETLQAKIASEPQLKKAAQQEIQQLLSCVDEIQAVKESLQAKTASEPSFHQATEIEIQQVLHACESLQNAKGALEAKSGKLKLHSAVQAELQQILSSADTLQTIKQSITAKVAEVESLTDTVHVEKIEVKTSVALPDKADKAPSTKADKVVEKSEAQPQLTTSQSKPQQELPTAEGSVKTPIQTDIQEFISVAEDFKDVKETLQAKIASEPQLKKAAQQEIQQLLSCVDEIQAVKESLQAKTASEPSFHQATEIEIQQVLHACESLQNAKEALEAKSGKLKLHSAVQAELQQILSSADTLQTIKQAITAKVAEVESLNSTAQIENVEIKTSVEHPDKLDKAPSTKADKVVEKSEVQPQLTTTQSKPQQEVPTEEGSVKTPIQTDIQEFISVAEDFKDVKETLQAKIASEPQLKKAAQQEIQQLLSCVDEIQAVKESLQAKTASEPSFHQTTEIEIQQVLHACESLQNAKEALEAKSGKLKLHSAVQAELQQILSSADTLQTIKQSITAKVAEVESLTDTVHVEKIEVKTSVALPDKADKAPSTKADKVVEKSEAQPQLTTSQSKPQQELPTAEGSVKTPIQTDIQEFISVAEDFKDVKETLQAKIASEPQLKKAAQQEIQQLLSCVDEIQAVKESLQAKTASEPSFHQATEIEIQQVLHACESLQNAKEALEAKSGKLKLHSAVQAELQQILSSADTLQTIKQAITAKIAEVESLNSTAQIENVEIKTSVEHPDKLDKAPSTKADKVVEKSEVQPQLTTTQSKPQQEVPTEEGSVKTPIQTDIQEFISVAEDFKDVKETLQAKIASEPQLKKAAQQEIQQLLSCVDEIQAVKESLQAKSASEPSFHQATEIEIQQVLHACESLQNAKEALEAKSGKLKLHSAVQAELQQILSSADTLQNIKQSITAKVAEVESLTDTVHVKKIEVKTSVALPDKADKAPSTKADKVVEKSEVQPQLTTTQSKPQQELPTAEGSVKTPIQTDIQEFISAAEDFKDVKETLQAKIASEPKLKKAAQQEIQQLLSCVDEIQAVKESLQAKTASEPSFHQATEIEIQQVLHACESLQNAKEALEAKSGKLKLHSAVQAELQQILSSADTLQTIKQAITAKVAEVESLNSTAQIENVEIKTFVEHPDKLDKAPSTKADKVVEKSEVQPQLTTTQSKPQQEVPTEEGSVKTPIQTDIQEFISVAEDFKDVKETLQAKIASEPQLKKAAQQEIQQLLSCVDEIQAVKESLQAKTASETSFHQATEIEIQQVLHACESLQNAKEALEAKSGKLKLHSAVQAELQQILSSSDTLQTIKQSITAKVAEVESLTDTVHVEKMEVKTSVDLSDKLGKVPTKPEEEIEVIKKPEVKEILSTEKAITAQDKLENQNKVEIQRKEDKVELIKKKEIKQVSKQKEDEVGEQLHSQTVTIPDETSQQIKIEQTEIQAGTEQTASNLQQETNVKSAITDEKVVISKPPEETSKLQMKKETITTQQTSAQQGSEEKDVTITKTSASETITGKTDDIKEIAIVKKTTEKDVVDSGVESKMIKGKEKEIMLKDKPEPKSGKISKEDSEEQSTPGSKEGGIKVFIDSDINKCQDDSSKLKISKEIVNDTQKQLAKEDDASLSKTDSKEKEIIVTKDEIVPLAEAKEPLKSKPQEDKSETGASASKSSLKEEFIVKEQELTNKDEEPSKTEIMSKKEKIKPQENKSSTEEKEKTKTDIVTKESEEKVLESQQKITKEGKTSLVEKNKTEIEDDKKEAQKSLNKDEKAALKEKPVSKTKELPEKKINEPLEEQEIKPKDGHTSHKQEDNKPKKETNKDGKNEEGELNSKKSSLKENQSLQLELESDKHKIIEKKVPSEVVSKESEIKSDVQPSQTEEDKSKKEPSTTKVSKEKKDKLTEAKKSQESSVKTEVTPTEKLNTSDVKPKLPEESKVNIEDKQINKGGKIADKSEVKTDENIKKDELPSKTAEDTKRSKDLKRKSESRKNSDGTVKASSKNNSESDGKPIEQSITYFSEVTTSQSETTPGDQEKETGKGEIVPSIPEDSVKKPSVKKGKDARKKSISPKKTTGPLPTNKLIEDKTAKDDTNKEDVSTKEVYIASVKRDNTDMDTKKVVEVSEIKSTEPKKESSELKTRIRKPVSPDLEKETIVSPTRKQGDIRDTYKSSNTQETNEDKGAGLRKGYETPREERNIENKLYIDESSTSDYSSQSQSESYNLKKSQSYESRQWIYDSKPEVKRDETLSTYTPKPVSERKRYESPTSASILEGTTYQRRETAAKPLFCGRLVDRTAAQGSRLRVTCSLIGSPEPTVQWFKDGQPLTTADPRLQTRLSNGLASLEINAATLGDSGKYTCIARNQNGEATTTSRVKIFSYLESAPEAPVFTQQVKGEYKFSADELVIQCRVKGYPLPTVSWFKDGLPLHASSRYQQTVARDGTCRLVVHGPEPSDSGLYKCVAENAVWSEHTSGCVMFEGREKYLVESRSLETRLPRFTNILSEHVVREGGTVALQVAIKGSPRADVTWYRGSEPLPKKSSRFRYLEDAGVYSLVMSDASTAEAGTYTCRAANAHGYRDTALFLQVVGGASRGKPAMFVSRPDTTHNIAMGEDINFAFRVSGDPKPKVTWMKGMKDITNNIRTMKETVNDYVRLTLNHATAVDSGTYFIMAKNCHGADHAFVTVRVRQRARSLTPTRSASLWSAPDTSTILRDIHESTRALVNDVPGPVSGEATVTDRGKNWVSLSWGKPEHRGAAPVLAYRVESWMLGSEGGAQWTELGVTPINSFDVFFLKPGGEYKFRITARNRYGWGESVTSTEPVVISSGSDSPPDIVRDLEGPLKALLGDSLTLECEITGDPAPSIQWLRDGQDVGTVASLKGRVFVSDSQTTHRLTVQQLSEDDSGRYVCEAVNPQGRASTYARLLVVSDPRLLEADRKLKEDLAANKEFAPQLTMRLRDRRVQQSYPVRLTCQVAANPAPTITWAHDGQPITDDGGRYTQRVEADHFYTLELPRTLLEDGGQYSVTAQNCLGAVSCSCQLVVDKGIRAYVAPDFIAPLDLAASVAEGAELRIFAQVEAYPSVGIAWQRDGVRLRPSRRLVMTVDPEGRVELALAHITSRDAGLYCCTATNAVGRAETTCHVSVTAGGLKNASLPSHPSIVPPGVPYSKEPRFVTKPRCSEAVEGDTVVITCEVVGDPQPEVMWLRDWLKDVTEG